MPDLPFHQAVILIADARDYIHQQLYHHDHLSLTSRPPSSLHKWAQQHPDDPYLASIAFRRFIPSFDKPFFKYAFNAAAILKPYTQSQLRAHHNNLDVRLWQVFIQYKFSNAPLSADIFLPHQFHAISDPAAVPNATNPGTRYERLIYLLTLGSLSLNPITAAQPPRKRPASNFRLSSPNCARVALAVQALVRAWDLFARLFGYPSIEVLIAPYVFFEHSRFMFRALSPHEGFAPSTQAFVLLPEDRPSQHPSSSYPSICNRTDSVHALLRDVAALYIADLNCYLCADAFKPTGPISDSQSRAVIFTHPSATTVLPLRFDTCLQLLLRMQQTLNRGIYLQHNAPITADSISTHPAIGNVTPVSPAASEDPKNKKDATPKQNRNSTAPAVSHPRLGTPLSEILPSTPPPPLVMEPPLNNHMKTPHENRDAAEQGPQPWQAASKNQETEQQRTDDAPNNANHGNRRTIPLANASVSDDDDSDMSPGHLTHRPSHMNTYPLGTHRSSRQILREYSCPSHPNRPQGSPENKPKSNSPDRGDPSRRPRYGSIKMRRRARTDANGKTDHHDRKESVGSRHGNWMERQLSTENDSKRQRKRSTLVSTTKQGEFEGRTRRTKADGTYLTVVSGATILPFILPPISKPPESVLRFLGALWQMPGLVDDLPHRATDMWPEQVVRRIIAGEEPHTTAVECAALDLYVNKLSSVEFGNGVYAGRSFVSGDVICAFYGRLAYEFEGDEPGSVVLGDRWCKDGSRIQRGERGLRVGLELPKMWGKLRMLHTGTIKKIRKAYVVPFEGCVASKVKDLRQGEDESVVNAECVQKRGKAGIHTLEELCEAGGVCLVACKEIKKGEEIRVKLQENDYICLAPVRGDHGLNRRLNRGELNRSNHDARGVVVGENVTL